MVGLLDLAATPATVVVRGVPLFVNGITGKGLLHLLGEYPDLIERIGAYRESIRLAAIASEKAGKKVSADFAPEDFLQLMKILGNAVGPIIAAGLGFPGNSEQEEAASSLPIEEQLDLLIPIIKRTMPGGAIPFFGKIQGLALAMNQPDAVGKGQDTTLPKQSSISPSGASAPKRASSR
jgi:hypothetical protein